MLNATQTTVCNQIASMSNQQIESIKSDANNTFQTAINTLQKTGRKSMSRAELLAIIRSTAPKL